MRFRVGFLALLGMAAAGCSSDGQVKDLFSETMRSVDSGGNPVLAGSGISKSIGNSGNAAAFTGAVYEGSGSFVSSRSPGVSSMPTASGGEGYSLNLVNAPIPQAAKSVLGDVLGVSYVVDPRVQGTVSLQTSNPVSKEALVGILESALMLNGAVIVQRGGTYQIVPNSDALASTPSVSVPSVAPTGPGIQVQVVELQYVAADEMRTILEPITRQGSILRADTARNHLVLAGTASDLRAMREAISVFDVDWMRGMSVAVHPLKTSQPAAVATELETVFGVKDGPGNKLIRFVPNERLNSVLVITSRPSYLARAASWIAKLDALASTGEEQLFVYEIQNRPAQELAGVLQSVLAREAGSSSGKGINNPVAPNLDPTLVSTDANAFVGESVASSDPMFGASTTSAKTSVVADIENNALLISTSGREYQRIERILRQLDVLPTQVLLEAIIAEVTLNDELKFGLRWAFDNGKISVGLSDVASGFVGAAFPGFSWGYATRDLRVTLNALSSITDVNVISSPTLMALNNQKAVLQVGDQVPIVTQQAQGTLTSDSRVINSVEMKDTGIILSVVPRVNSSGRVMLDIQQEVSSVVKTTSSGIDSPTIQQRKLQTRVVVNDGESLALGGLIQEKNSLSRGQVPILGNIPILGNAFKNKTDTIGRTELIIFIKPTVVRNIQEARGVTEEFRKKLDFRSAIQKRRGGVSETEQTVKRLAY